MARPGGRQLSSVYKPPPALGVQLHTHPWRTLGPFLQKCRPQSCFPLSAQHEGSHLGCVESPRSHPVSAGGSLALLSAPSPVTGEQREGAHRISMSLFFLWLWRRNASNLDFSFWVLLLASSSLSCPGSWGSPGHPSPRCCPAAPASLGETLPGGLRDPWSRALPVLPGCSHQVALQERRTATLGPGREQSRSRERPRPRERPRKRPRLQRSGPRGHPQQRGTPCPPPAGCWHRAPGSRLLPWFRASRISLFPDFRTK